MKYGSFQRIWPSRGQPWRRVWAVGKKWGGTSIFPLRVVVWVWLCTVRCLRRRQGRRVCRRWVAGGSGAHRSARCLWRNLRLLSCLCHHMHLCKIYHCICKHENVLNFVWKQCTFVRCHHFTLVCEDGTPVPVFLYLQLLQKLLAWWFYHFKFYYYLLSHLLHLF